MKTLRMAVLYLGSFQRLLLTKKHLRECSPRAEKDVAWPPEFWRSVRKQGLRRSSSKLCLLHSWEGFLGEAASLLNPDELNSDKRKAVASRDMARDQGVWEAVPKLDLHVGGGR